MSQKRQRREKVYLHVLLVLIHQLPNLNKLFPPESCDITVTQACDMMILIASL